MNFERINRVLSTSSQGKGYKKISDLEAGRFYRVDNIRKVDTKYGLKVVVDLEDHQYLYLPNRACEEILMDESAQFNALLRQLRNARLYLKLIDSSKKIVNFFPEIN